MTVVKLTTVSTVSTTSPSAAGSHWNSRTILATKHSAWRIPTAYPGHMHPPPGAERHHLDLLAPGDVHVVPLAAVHAVSSRPISTTMKFTSAPLGTAYPPISAPPSLCTPCGRRKSPGGCSRSPSITTAFRYGVAWPWMSPPSGMDFFTSSCSLAWSSGWFTSSAMIHSTSELGAEAGHLGVRERPVILAAVVGHAQREEGLGVARRLVVAARGVDERHEHLVLSPCQRDVRRPSPAEEALGDRREEGEDREGGVRHEHAALQLLDLSQRLLADPRAEAHVHHQPEHGAAQRRPQLDNTSRVAGAEEEEVGDEGVAGARPRRREEGDAGAVEGLGGEVAADEAPVGTAVRLGERRAVGEGGAALDEGAVGEAAVGDEDERGGEEAEGDDGAVARVEVAEERAEVEDGAPERQELGEEEQHRRPGREPPSLVAAASRAMAAVKQEEEER
nr:unnamed protein product [Digitaria exilis]